MDNVLINIELEKYSENVFIEGGKKVVYETILKVLYGTLVAILIFMKGHNKTNY